MIYSLCMTPATAGAGTVPGQGTSLWGRRAGALQVPPSSALLGVATLLGIFRWLYLGWALAGCGREGTQQGGVRPRPSWQVLAQSGACGDPWHKLQYPKIPKQNFTH